METARKHAASPGEDFLTRRSPFFERSEVALRVAELATHHRAVAHLLCGWTAKMSSILDKRDLARSAYEHLVLSSRYRTSHECLTVLCDTPPDTRPVFDVYQRLDDLEQPESVIVTLARSCWPWVQQLTNDFLLHSDPIGNSPSRRIAQDGVRQLASDLERFSDRAKIDAHDTSGGAIACDLDRARITDNVHPDVDVWSPWHSHGRIAVPARAPIASDTVPGSLRWIITDHLMNQADLGRYLHSLAENSLCTAELASRNSYEHPDMPLRFHLDMVRQAQSDLEFATQLSTAATQACGAQSPDAFSVDPFCNEYAFDPVTPGSRHELLWRLLVKQTLHQGLTLDAFVFETKRRQYVGQDDLSELFAAMSVAEFESVRAGVQWTHRVAVELNSSVIDERHTAHTFYCQRLAQRRNDFVQTYPHLALKELRAIEESSTRQRLLERQRTIPIKRRLEGKLREAAGFTSKEIQQVIEWGYV